MTLDLTDEESAALLAELDRVIDGDRYPFSPRIRTLTAIRDKLRRRRCASRCRRCGITRRRARVADVAGDDPNWGAGPGRGNVVPQENRVLVRPPSPAFWPSCQLSGGAQFSNSLDFCAGSTRPSPIGRVDGSIAATSAGHSHAGAASYRSRRHPAGT
jgi:hypothetical protein